MDDESVRELAEHLCSRFGHDLAGVIGAIGNGIELIEEAGGAADADTLKLLRQSANTAIGRLQFFRLAYGAAGNGTPDVGFEAALAYARAVVPQRTTVEWRAAGPSPRPGPGAVKLMLNATLLAAECMPRGGVVRVAVDGASTLTVEAAPATGAVQLDAAAQAVLEKAPAPGTLGARTAHAAYFGRIARDAGSALTVGRSDGKLTLSLKLPQA